MKEGVYIEDGYLILNIAYPYEIELSRIDTPLKILGWIVHLLEKTWMTCEALDKMIDVLEQHFKLNLHDL